MRIYLARHTRANTGPSAVGESALCPKGLVQACVLGDVAKELSPRVVRVLSAPEREARATAEIIANRLSVPLAPAAELGTGRSVGAVIELIQDVSPVSGILLVGQNPQMGELLAVLCSGLGARRLILRTGELVGVDIHPGQVIGTGRVAGRWANPDAFVQERVGSAVRVAA